MGHNMVLSYEYSVKQNIGGGERMCLRHMPFGWSCGGVEAKHVESPNAACQELLRKPLDAKGAARKGNAFGSFKYAG